MTAAATSCIVAARPTGLRAVSRRSVSSAIECMAPLDDGEVSNRCQASGEALRLQPPDEALERAAAQMTNVTAISAAIAKRCAFMATSL
jgi:hypothetical protein